jgi:hypothetical protein
MKEMVNLNAFTISTNCVDFQVDSRGRDLENVQLDVNPVLSDKEVFFSFISLSMILTVRRSVVRFTKLEVF